MKSMNCECYTLIEHSNGNGPGLKMYFLFKMGIFQPAMCFFGNVAGVLCLLARIWGVELGAFGNVSADAPTAGRKSRNTTARQSREGEKRWRSRVALTWYEPTAVIWRKLLILRSWSGCEKAVDRLNPIGGMPSWNAKWPLSSSYPMSLWHLAEGAVRRPLCGCARRIAPFRQQVAFVPRVSKDLDGHQGPVGLSWASNAVLLCVSSKRVSCKSQSFCDSPWAVWPQLRREGSRARHSTDRRTLGDCWNHHTLNHNQSGYAGSGTPAKTLFSPAKTNMEPANGPLQKELGDGFPAAFWKQGRSDVVWAHCGNLAQVTDTAQLKRLRKSSGPPQSHWRDAQLKREVALEQLARTDLTRRVGYVGGIECFSGRKSSDCGQTDDQAVRHGFCQGCPCSNHCSLHYIQLKHSLCSRGQRKKKNKKTVKVVNLSSDQNHGNYSIFCIEGMKSGPQLYGDCFISHCKNPYKNQAVFHGSCQGRVWFTERSLFEFLGDKLQLLDSWFQHDRRFFFGSPDFWTSSLSTWGILRASSFSWDRIPTDPVFT